MSGQDQETLTQVYDNLPDNAVKIISAKDIRDAIESVRPLAGMTVPEPGLDPVFSFVNTATWEPVVSAGWFGTPLQKFTDIAGVGNLIYSGTVPLDVAVQATFSIFGDKGDKLWFAIGVNGVVEERAVSVVGIPEHNPKIVAGAVWSAVLIQPGDVIGLYVRNLTGGGGGPKDIEIRSAQLYAMGVATAAVTP